MSKINNVVKNEVTIKVAPKNTHNWQDTKVNFFVTEILGKAPTINEKGKKIENSSKTRSFVKINKDAFNAIVCPKNSKYADMQSGYHTKTNEGNSSMFIYKLGNRTLYRKWTSKGNAFQMDNKDIKGILDTVSEATPKKATYTKAAPLTASALGIIW